MKCKIRYFVFIVTLLLAGYIQGVNAGDKLLTVERVYSDPPLIGRLPSGVQWSPNSRLVTYIKQSAVDDEYDLWALDVKSGERYPLVKSDDLIDVDSDREISVWGYQWSPTGREVLLKQRGSVYLYNINDKNLHRITKSRLAGKDMTFSPDGKWLAFVREYNIYVLNLSTGDEIQLTKDGRKHVMNGQADWVYCEEFELCKPFWWSPDSKHISFIQFDERRVPEYPIVDFIPYHPEIEWEKYPKAGDQNSIVKVGVVSIENQEITWSGVVSSMESI